jgi:hypothetical protein
MPAEPITDEPLTGEQLRDSAGRRQCMWIDPCQGKWNPRLASDGYIPSLVTENQPGHSPMSGDPRQHQEPWFWGKTLDDAERTAASYNARHGTSKRDAWTIVASSIGASRAGS